MASDIKISELTVASSSSDSDVLPIVQSNETKQVTKAVFMNSIKGAALGNITGAVTDNNLVLTETKVDGTVTTQTIPLGSITVDDVLDSTSENPVQNKVIYTALQGKEDNTNKVTSIDENSTDTQYPSAKCVYDIVGDIETILTRLDVRKWGGVDEYSNKNNKYRRTYRR